MKGLSQEKNNTLIAALNERYNAMRTIRDRVQSVGIWALGLFLGAGGWLIQSQTSLTLSQKLLYMAGLAVAVWVLRFKYLKDLEDGFKSQQRAAVRLEKALGLFSPGVFDDSEEGVYPPKWELAGNSKGEGNFFTSSYLLLYVGAAFLTCSILLCHIPRQKFHFRPFVSVPSECVYSNSF